MSRRIYIITLLISLLLSINACSAVLTSPLGTNYNSELKLGITSRDEIHKRFGQPVSSQTYSSPMDTKDKTALLPCRQYMDDSKHQHYDPAQGKSVNNSEVFRIKGRVIRPGENWKTCVAADLYTLGLAEIMMTPKIIYDWFREMSIEKDLTVYYRTDDRFAGGEIRYTNPRTDDEENGFIMDLPFCIFR